MRTVWENEKIGIRGREDLNGTQEKKGKKRKGVFQKYPNVTSKFRFRIIDTLGSKPGKKKRFFEFSFVRFFILYISRIGYKQLKIIMYIYILLYPILILHS